MITSVAAGDPSILGLVRRIWTWLWRPRAARARPPVRGFGPRGPKGRAPRRPIVFTPPVPKPSPDAQLVVATIEKLLPRLDQIQAVGRDGLRAQAGQAELLARIEALLRDPPPRRHGALDWTLVGLIAGEAAGACYCLARLL